MNIEESTWRWRESNCKKDINMWQKGVTMFDGMKKTSSEIAIPLKIKMEDNRRRQKVNRTWDDKEDTDAVSVHEGG